MKSMMIKGLLIIFLLAVVFVGLFTWAEQTDRRINVNNFSVSKLGNRQINLNNVDNLSITVRSTKLKIVSGDVSKVILKNVSKDQYKIDETNNDTRIFEKNADRHNFEIGKSSEIKIVVPKKVKDITIRQLNGTINLNNLEVSQLNIEHQNGTTLANGLKIDELGSIDKKNGKTSLNDINVKGLKVSIKNGGFTLNGTKKISSNETYDDHESNQLRINSGSGQVMIKTR
ncbi:DUF4097 family beta strand repeat-containing protein [Companilactobacillus baiquanensis]|uniref:DUF4097 family beta strand repeat-containing protein n=1 Tax=Companilactobacillus baiquanensis TaxID=2486005 RepID=A0ABW1UYS3_9LACO|nr:DUF4097 family beta strand repeat-containing protein [Companilactobacillus baiquanensis]